MKLLVILVSLVFIFSCKKADDLTTAADIQETAQQVGDVMASVDEAGGSSGSVASNYQEGAKKTFARLAPNDPLDSRSWIDLVQPPAIAATCAGAGFGACTANSITRTFGGCTVGTATFNGTVTLTWTGSGAGTCTAPGIGDSITRVPSFNVTGRRGSAVLTVSKTGTNGQVMTVASGAGASRTFTFANDGINRTFTLSGTPLFNQTTVTTTPLTISGTSRTNRVISAGTIQVTNNLTAEVCDYSPTAVTWTAGCNCPTSGSWAGTCTGGKSTNLEITGCGTATFTNGTASESVTLDRCGT